MVDVPAARYDMGSTGGRPDEAPVHPVEVAAFQIDVTEVTAAAYGSCIAAGACTDAASTEAWCNVGIARLARHPANCVTWHQAQAYCRWVGKRLPTEQEWELAARGTDGRIYPWGNGAHGGEECELTGRATCEVGTAPAGKSPYGALDMVGNAEEWTSSPYCPYLHKCDTATVVARGGASDFIGGTATSRMAYPPGARGEALGFRCAR